MIWDGKERRMSQTEDHDILIEIKNDVKHLVANFNSHVKEDKIYWDKIENINIKIATWTGIGTGMGVLAGCLFKAMFK